MPQAGGATLYLHIGRNKAGSSTLQSYFRDNAAALREAGVQYALFNQPSSPGCALPTFATHRDISGFVLAQPGGSVLVSHEGLCCFTRDMTRIMAADLAKLDLRVIFYVRPYTDWIVSSYCFDVRMGINGRDFDRYLDWMHPAISCWPTLEIWGGTIGWDRLHVRSLNPLDLHGGDLLSDCLTAIGLPAVQSTGRENASPNWMIVELLRLVVGRDAASGWDTTRLAIAEALHELADMAIDASATPRTPARYLTPRQAHTLAALYNDDLARLTRYTGVNLQDDRRVVATGRDAPPSAGWIPQPVLRGIKSLALRPAYARVHPEIAEFVSSPAYSDLLG